MISAANRASPLPILNAARQGDLDQVAALREQGAFPRDSILIGISTELDRKESVGPGIYEYFKRLADTDVARQMGKVVIPVPINSDYSGRIPQGVSGQERLDHLKNLVKKDVAGLDGVVVPGDPYNFPALRGDIPIRDAIHTYPGPVDAHDFPSIYGITAREFYERYPDHKLNPCPDSIQYEAVLLDQVAPTDQVVMTSCHGTQIYALLQGAKMVAGIAGHNDSKPHLTKLKPGSLNHALLGDEDRVTRHVHKLALDGDSMPEGLEVTGVSDGHVEVIEEKQGKPYYGYQPHPEFTEGHPAIEAFVGSVIQRHLKQAVLKELAV